MRIPYCTHAAAYKDASEIYLLFTDLIGVLRSTRKYFTYTTAASTMAGGDQAVPWGGGGDPQPSAGCIHTCTA